jgi:hypothetical protein
MTEWEKQCAGPDGCGYRGPDKEFQTGIPQRPCKCPRCNKTYTFRCWKKGEVDKR